MYSCTDLKIYRFCISVEVSSPKESQLVNNEQSIQGPKEKGQIMIYKATVPAPLVEPDVLPHISGGKSSLYFIVNLLRMLW